MPEKEIPKLIIPPKKYKVETTVVSVRMPKNMIADLDKVAESTGMEFALKNLEVN